MTFHGSVLARALNSRRNSLSSARASSVEKRRENGESNLFFSFPSVLRALLFPFYPAPARFLFPLLILQPTGKTKEISAKERGRKLFLFNYTWICRNVALTAAIKYIIIPNIKTRILILVFTVSQKMKRSRKSG